MPAGRPGGKIYPEGVGERFGRLSGRSGTGGCPGMWSHAGTEWTPRGLFYQWSVGNCQFRALAGTSVSTSCPSPKQQGQTALCHSIKCRLHTSELQETWAELVVFSFKRRNVDVLPTTEIRKAITWKMGRSRFNEICEGMPKRVGPDARVTKSAGPDYRGRSPKFIYALASEVSSGNI